MAFDQNAYNNALQQWGNTWTAPQGYLEQGLEPQTVADDFVNYWVSQGADQTQLQSDVTGVLRNAGVYGSSDDGGLDSGGSRDSGGGGGGGTAVDNDYLKYLDSQINRYRGELDNNDTTRDLSLTNVDNSYNTRVDKANQDRSRFLEDASRSRDDSIRQRETAYRTSDSNTRNLADSVRGVLGQASGSGSSAYKLLAPHLIAKLASSQRSGITDTFGKNEQEFDVRTKRASADFDKLLEELSLEREQQRASTLADIYAGRQDIYRTLGDLAGDRVRAAGGSYDDLVAAQNPYFSNIQTLTDRMNQLPENYNQEVKVNPVNPQAPNFADYQVDKQSLNAQRQFGGSGGSPYAPFLKKRFNENA